MNILKLVLLLLSLVWLPALAESPPCTVGQKVDLATLKSRIIVVGEWHGTNEIPAFVTELACAIVKTGKPLILGLEIPTDLQAGVNDYINSQGSAVDQQKFIATDFGKLEDGRGSLAIFNLIEAMRKIRSTGAQLAVMGFDLSEANLPPPLYPGEKIWKGERNMAMARNIESRAHVYPHHTLLNLVGIVHASKKKGASWDIGYEPMAYLLSQRIPIHTINFTAKGGFAWFCGKPSETGQLNCKENAVAAFAKSPEGDFDTWVDFEKFSASKPVRQ
jgi:hypothetical protein